MNKLSYDRRTMLKAILAGSIAPWVITSRSFAASSCDDHIVRVGAVVDPDSMNPFATWGSFWPLTFCYDALVGVDAQRHPDRKGFAKGWSVAEDNVTWTFKIWPGMKWSDGKPATAKDVLFTYEYLRASVGKPHELNAGWNNASGLDVIKSITASDDETLIIVTKTPSNWPLDNTIMIVPEHIWKDISYADAGSGFPNDPPTVGTGPLIVSEFKRGQFARMTSNPYFRSGEPLIAGMILYFYSTSDPILQGLKSADLDYAYGLTGAQWADVSNDPEIVGVQFGIEQRNFLAFNTTAAEGAGSTKALQDPAFRDAIGYAIDQKTIVDRAFQGHAEPGVGLVPPVVAEYYSDLHEIRRHFDLAEAGRRLDAAGYRDADGDGIREDKEGNGFQLELISGTFSGFNEIPVATLQLISGWLGQIGIPVSVTQLDSGALENRTAPPEKGGGQWDLLVAGNWRSPDLTSLTNIAKSGELDNRSYWKNKRFDALVSEVKVTVDPGKRKDLMDQAVRLAYVEAPYIMLSYPLTLCARRKDCFEGWGEQDAVSAWSYFPFDRMKPINKS
ncbi:ABC transporter substrate-binding protein [Mesorhizobium sp.]|uniref:ABC transporter substrate-binding protein n=1 Tax=Mesorhizobium sp. TaxID=1871066 RepID=UPI000FE590FB|nr:ABC transporter substrate-binding protein [Mesorhizobium sp.]RWB69686.1 MAG: ABC transporter substrate-binding protein [Mesorhizobium sp.]